MTPSWPVEEIEALIREEWSGDHGHGYDVSELARAIAAEHEKRVEHAIEMTARSWAELGEERDALKARLAALREALDRIETGDKGDWHCDGPCGDIAGDALSANAQAERGER